MQSHPHEFASLYSRLACLTLWVRLSTLPFFVLGCSKDPAAAAAAAAEQRAGEITAAAAADSKLKMVAAAGSSVEKNVD